MEELEPRNHFYENLLFALLGAMTALIVGISSFESEGMHPGAPAWRQPASAEVSKDPTLEKLESRIALPILE